MAIIKDEAYYRAKIAAAIIVFNERVLIDPSYEEKWRQSSAYRYWAICVIRYARECQCCDNPKDLHAHHIKDAATHPDLRFEISNGVSLCNECHKYIHNAIAGGYRNGCSDIELTILFSLKYHRRILRRKLDRVIKSTGYSVAA